MKREFKDLVGSIINKIFMNEMYLKFETDKGNVCLTVRGDCCSESVFYDFIGVKKLLRGNKVVAVEWIELRGDDITGVERDMKDKKSYQESISVYGYRIVTLDSILGEVSSVFSFRNYSNGYYGGWMESCEDREVKPEIFDDILETVQDEEKK